MLRTLTLTYSWAKSSNTAYFIIKCWKCHVTYWLLYWKWKTKWLGFPGGAVVENLPANAGDTGSSPGLVWEDPTCRRAAGPVSRNYWACASGACAPQRERPRQWEARTPRWRVAPARRNWRKPSHRNEDPTQTKINKFIKKKKDSKYIGCLPLWLCGWQMWLAAVAQHHESIVSPGKDQNSKFKVWFLLNAYSFCTITDLKNPKLNHHKQGTSVCYCRGKAAIDNMYTYGCGFVPIKLYL